MTKFNFTDERENTVPTFGDLDIGDLFTSVDGVKVYIKTEIIYDDDKNPHNTVSLDGDFYWSDVDEEIKPIQEIEIVIKK